MVWETANTVPIIIFFLRYPRSMHQHGNIDGGYVHQMDKHSLLSYKKDAHASK